MNKGFVSNFKEKLTPREIQLRAVSCKGISERGTPCFFCFLTPAFMKKLFQDLEIPEHDVPVPEKGKWIPQDVWVVKRK